MQLHNILNVTEETHRFDFTQ